jgi:hypothetical protein
MEKSDIKALKAQSNYNSFELQYLKFACEMSKE